MHHLRLTVRSEIKERWRPRHPRSGRSRAARQAKRPPVGYPNRISVSSGGTPSRTGTMLHPNPPDTTKQRPSSSTNP